MRFLSAPMETSGDMVNGPGPDTNGLTSKMVDNKGDCKKSTPKTLNPPIYVCP